MRSSIAVRSASRSRTGTRVCPVSIDANGRAQARIIRFNYDIERTLAAMQDSSLPKGLRKDLKLGTKRIFML
jgi:hypothetical protein